MNSADVGQAMPPGGTFPGRRRSSRRRIPLRCAERGQGGGGERVAQGAEGLRLEGIEGQEGTQHGTDGGATRTCPARLASACEFSVSQ